MPNLKEILFKNKYKSKEIFIISALILFSAIVSSIVLISYKYVVMAVITLSLGIVLYYIFQNLANVIYNQNEIIRVLKKEIESKEK